MVDLQERDRYHRLLGVAGKCVDAWDADRGADRTPRERQLIRLVKELRAEAKRATPEETPEAPAPDWASMLDVLASWEDEIDERIDGYEHLPSRELLHMLRAIIEGRGPERSELTGLADASRAASKALSNRMWEVANRGREERRILREALTTMCEMNEKRCARLEADVAELKQELVKARAST